MRRFLPWLFAVLAVSVATAALAPGDLLPDTSKIPLVTLDGRRTTLESRLLDDGVVIVHFLSPRPPRGAPFRVQLAEELSALHKACLAAPYRCRAVAVIPFGEKGAEDALAILNATDADDAPWGGVGELFYEPTFPRPGLYRTFRGAVGAGADEIVTPLTYLVGPGRKILAAREPNEGGGLYEWVQQALPATVTPAPGAPSTDLSLPAPSELAWPAFRRTAQRKAQAARPADALAYTYLAWQREVGRTFASPAVLDGTIYLSTDSDGLQSMILTNGEALERFNPGSSWWTSPAVAGDFVYTVADGTLYALDRARLRRQWSYEIGALVTSSPVVAAGRLYLGARDGAVYALDAVTGQRLWAFQTGGEISSSPAVADGTLVIGSGDRCVYALDAATGAERWSYETGGPVDSSPVIDGGEIYVGSFDGHLYALKLAGGALSWRTELGGWVHSSPAVDADTVFVGTVNVPRDVTPTFNWVDRRTGQRKGSFELPDAVYSSPTLWEDLVLVGCRDRQLYAFDRAMRQIQPVWTFKTRSYVHASPVVVGDTVLVASFDGNLYALRSAKPIEAWRPADVVPRWFMAALARQLHAETADLVARAAQGEVDAERSLTAFAPLFDQVRGQVREPRRAGGVLPRDVPLDHPGAPFIEYVLTAGLLSGYPDATFRPSEPTTRYQFASAFASVLDWVTRPEYVWRVLQDRQLGQVQVEVRADPIRNRPHNLPVDVPEEHWAHDSLAMLAERGLLPVDDEGEFQGSRLVTLRDAEAMWELLVQSVRVRRVK